MHSLLAELIAGFAFHGTLSEDVTAFLRWHGHAMTAEHSAGVAAEAHRLALRFGLDAERAQEAGWLHDVSAVFPGSQRVQVAAVLGLALLPEEHIFPPIVHQRLSALMARELFGIHDEAVLAAVACHTTLRAGATPLDQVLFVADKLAWDQAGLPPYLDGLCAALEVSLEEGAWYFVRYLWERRATLAVVHSWLYAAYVELAEARGIAIEAP